MDAIHTGMTIDINAVGTSATQIDAHQTFDRFIHNADDVKMLDL